MHHRHDPDAIWLLEKNDRVRKIAAEMASSGRVEFSEPLRIGRSLAE